MASNQADNLLTIVGYYSGCIDLPQPTYGISQYAFDRKMAKQVRVLAGQIIAGTYPVLRNVMDDDVTITELKYGTGEDESHKQPHPEFGQGVCEYVDWFYDNEDARYEDN